VTTTALRALLALALLCAPSGVRADPTDIADIPLEDLLNQGVTTASGGVSEARSTTAANVHSVSREEIARNGWTSLAQVLASVPGLYVTDDLTLPSVGVRGVTGGLRSGTRIIKIMIDGQPVNFRPDLTAFIGPEFLPMEVVDRIEVARGPLSALYGANAFLATVNVITRRPHTGAHGEAATRLHVVRDRVGYGGSALVSYAGSRADFLAAVSWDRIDRSGLQIGRTYSAQQSPKGLELESSQEDYCQPMSAFVSVSKRSARFGSVTAQGGLQSLDAGGQFQLNSVLSGSRVQFTNFWSGLSYDKNLGDRFSLGLRGGYARGRPGRDRKLLLTRNPAYTFQPRVGYDAVEGGLDATASFGDRLQLRMGLDAERDAEQILYYIQILNRQEGIWQAGDRIELIPDEHPRAATMRGLGAYLQLTSTPVGGLPDLRVTGNFRLDRITFGSVRYPLQYSWRGAAAYRFSPRLATKVIAGRAFQTPSGILLFGEPGFGNINNVIGSTLITGSGSGPVRPQTVNSAELVTSGTLGDNVSLELGLFYQSIVDRIDFRQSGAYFVASNHGGRVSVGSEGTLRLRLMRGLDAFASGTLIRPMGNGPSDELPLELFPKRFGRLGANLEMRQLFFNLNAQLTWADERGASQSNIYLNNGTPYALPAYTSVDLSLSSLGLDLLGEAAETRISATVRNLLDARPFEPGFAGFDVPNQGRTFLIELRELF
jgi:outer membrane receptor protein involved in Fe transport